MQQFVLIAYDGTDAGALERRLAVREAHLAGVGQMKDAGTFIQGGAILNDAGMMIGSVMIAAFPSRTAFDEWLITDPYVTGGVWQQIDVQPFRCVVL